MNNTITWQEYSDFVTNLASETSKSTLQNKIDLSLLGLGGELGEITDIVKKLLFHGIEFTDAYKDKLIKEAGDFLWYLTFFAKNVIDFNLFLLNDDDGVVFYEYDSSDIQAVLRNMYMSFGDLCLYISTLTSIDVQTNEVVMQNIISLYDGLCCVINSFIGTTINNVVDVNMQKLRERYKTGIFTTAEFVQKEQNKNI